MKDRANSVHGLALVAGASILHREECVGCRPYVVCWNSLIFRGLGQEVGLVLADFMLQRRGQFIHIAGRKTHHARLEQRNSVAPDGVASNLYKQSLHCVGIIFLWAHADQFLQRDPKRQRFAVRTRADHGVESVGQGYDPYCLRHFVAMHSVGIAGSVSALMMPADNFRNLGPGELHVADDLMSNHSVIRHLAKLLSIERRWLAEESLVDCYLADVMQVSRGT